MRIWMAPYTLVAKRSLSSRAQGRERPGALLRIEDGDGYGYADLHPWPELGDLSLDEQIKVLAAGGMTPLLKRSIALADLDREARLRNVSAFAGLRVPDSHFLVSDLMAFGEDDLREIRASGFTRLKIKIGRQLAHELECLRWVASFDSSVKLRLDLNGVLTSEQALSFFLLLPQGLREQIEFIEDPCPWNAAQWSDLVRETQLSLALDRIGDSSVGSDSPQAFQWMILKPALQDPDSVARVARSRGAKICITSYLDHPVGQAGAALEAARLLAKTPKDQIGICGLVSHQSFEFNSFSQLLSSSGPGFTVPPGTGIGFDDLLARENWKQVR